MNAAVKEIISTGTKAGSKAGVRIRSAVGRAKATAGKSKARDFIRAVAKGKQPKQWAKISGPAATLQLTRQQIDEIQVAFDKIRAEVVADLGAADAQHIRTVIKRGRTSAIVGRTALMFGVDPLSWVLGVGALAYAKILDNMEIGHNVMHGQYDWMNDPVINSEVWEWDIVCTAENWRNYHNFEHHTYTNIIGKDRDFGYTVLRLSDQQAWELRFLFQPILNLFVAVLFQWGVGVHDQKIEDILEGRASIKDLHERMKPFYRKAGKQLFKDYVLFPLLAGPNAPRVFLGNMAANVLRNLWTYSIIFCGHFTEGVSVYSAKDTKRETRGDWYVRQLLGSSNLEGSKFFYEMTGHLSHQIEHHLFPDIPAPRYQQIAPQVRAICEKYGIPYNTGSFWKQYGEVLQRVFVYSVPSTATSAVPA